ncbi:uncharacterized protein STEHIDRAFT_49753 [Stereum hirsutum FP-91666 SS1]|uniref:uncharacterized protein n=1 Tax=Stereum hirsutum (strain FP-91666) TaxID=721885 RepID=UPI000440C7F5|nr:uncharacterized protein STEHIDRAFT_49753 [Stereum hirsutum FP-91666 SS1]EIM90952.1 hypothetical protein STEHIDRAFT_49753 [Stereum hirsutum FP-91666 SS1]
MPEVIDLTDLPSDLEEDPEQSPPPYPDEEDEGSIPREETRPQLLDAIQTVPEQRLRQLVTNLVYTLPAAEQALTDELVVVRKRTREVASRWEVCDHCDEEFDVGTKRRQGECQYHPGDLEVNYEAFVDWDPDCHGPEDTPQNRRDFPENFQWNCCDEDGTVRGCEKGVHVPLEHKRRRS